MQAELRLCIWSHARIAAINTLGLQVLVAGWLAFGALGQEQKPAASVPELQGRLASLVGQPRFAAALWGLKVVSLHSGKTIFEHNPQKLFSPASNSKLYTMALVLDRLGANYRIKTSLYAKSRPDQDGTVNSDLALYGRGDPTINARLHNNNIYEAVEPLVRALTNAGVKRVIGDLVADESYFHGPPAGSGWAWDDMEYSYGAEISALTINDNTLQVLVKPAVGTREPCRLTMLPETPYVALSNGTSTSQPGGRRGISFYRPLDGNVIYVSGQMPLDDPGYTEDVTLHNPAGLFGAFFKESLARHGIKIDGKVRTRNWLEHQGSAIPSDRLVELGSTESPPMSELVREVMKPSQNLYTDLLLAQVGEQRRRTGASAEATSEELGITELNKFLGEVGIKSGEVLFEEGSGLSRNNLATPNATVALLQFMSRHKYAEAFLQALPVAGVDGTLRNRMKGTPAAGNVRAKTGSLLWAASLSGYVTTAAGEHLVFSAMLNRYHSSDAKHSARADLDAIAVMLAGFTGRASE